MIAYRIIGKTGNIFVCDIVLCSGNDKSSKCSCFSSVSSRSSDNKKKKRPNSNGSSGYSSHEHSPEMLPQPSTSTCPDHVPHERTESSRGLTPDICVHHSLRHQEFQESQYITLPGAVEKTNVHPPIRASKSRKQKYSAKSRPKRSSKVGPTLEAGHWDSLHSPSLVVDNDLLMEAKVHIQVSTDEESSDCSTAETSVSTIEAPTGSISDGSATATAEATAARHSVSGHNIGPALASMSLPRTHGSSPSSSPSASASSSAAAAEATVAGHSAMILSDRNSNSKPLPNREIMTPEPATDAGSNISKAQQEGNDNNVVGLALLDTQQLSPRRWCSSYPDGGRHQEGRCENYVNSPDTKWANLYPHASSKKQVTFRDVPGESSTDVSFTDQPLTAVSTISNYEDRCSDESQGSSCSVQSGFLDLCTSDSELTRHNTRNSRLVTLHTDYELADTYF